MPRLLKLDGGQRPRIVDDARHWVEDPDATLETLPEGEVLVPLALWQAQRDALLERGRVGVWLAPGEEVETLADDLEVLDVIGLHFPVFSDGRGLSSAVLLRDRHGFRGEIRALGDVQRDQLHYMRRCGFDAFAVRGDLYPEEEAAGLFVMSDHYQGDIHEPRPAFARLRRPIAA